MSDAGASSASAPSLSCSAVWFAAVAAPAGSGNAAADTGIAAPASFETSTEAGKLPTATVPDTGCVTPDPSTGRRPPTSAAGSLALIASRTALARSCLAVVARPARSPGVTSSATSAIRVAMAALIASPSRSTPDSSASSPSVLPSISTSFARTSASVASVADPVSAADRSATFSGRLPSPSATWRAAVTFTSTDPAQEPRPNDICTAPTGRSVPMPYSVSTLIVSCFLLTSYAYTTRSARPL